MTDEFHTRWAKGHEFAEVAEALHVRTDQIMAMLPGSIVLYTPGDDEEIWSATLKRTEDGTLRPVRREPQPGMWDKIKQQVETGMHERFGKPKP